MMESGDPASACAQGRGNGGGSAKRSSRAGEKGGRRPIAWAARGTNLAVALLAALFPNRRPCQ